MKRSVGIHPSPGLFGGIINLKPPDALLLSLRKTGVKNVTRIEVREGGAPDGHKPLSK